MLSHRIDFALQLVGPMRRLVANLMTSRRSRGARRTTPTTGSPFSRSSATARVVSWRKVQSSPAGATNPWRSLDYVEINGSEATFEFTTGKME